MAKIISKQINSQFLPTYINGVPMYMCGGKMQYGVGGSVLQGATSGATAGSLFGPWGTAIGGIVGGASGLISGLGEQKQQEQMMQQQQQAQQQQKQAIQQQMINNLPGQPQYVPTFVHGGKIKERLYNNLYPVDYNNPIKRVWDAVVLNKKDKNKENTPIDIEDAYSLYMNKPQKNKTLSISKYRPSKTTDNNQNYYSINNMDPNNIIKYADKFNQDTIVGGNNIMKNYKLSKGVDSNGKYISYYDKWDINPLNLKNPFNNKEINTDFGTPFEIYDRVYYEDNPNFNPNVAKQLENIREKLINSTEKNGKYYDENNNEIKIPSKYYSKPEYLDGIEDSLSTTSQKYKLKNLKNTDIISGQVEIKSHGGEILDRVKSFDTGGLHSENGGIPVGQNAMVERDEYMFTTKNGQKYIFSNKLMRQ